MLASTANKLRRPSTFVAAVIFLAFTIRLILVLCVFREVAAPTLDHNEFGWEMGWTARSIALGRGFSSPFLPITGPTALVPPLYPYIIAEAFKLFGIYTTHAAFVVLCFNSLLSALTCIPIFFATKNSLNQRAARVAAFAWAIYPFAIYFSAVRVWDYALTSLLFAICFWAAQRLHLHGPLAWIGFGLLFGVTALSNPSVLSTFPFLLLIAVIKVRRVDGRWLGNALLTLVTFAVVCAPWAIRNARVLHTGSVFRDGFWLEFYAGNNGDTSESNAAWVHPASNPVEMQKYITLGEIPYMQEKHDLAIDFLRHHPAFFAQATARRIVRFWTGYWSFSARYLKYEPLDVPNVFFCTVLTLLLFRGIRRWWQEDRAAVLPYLALVIFFPIAYYVTHSSMDYRQPIEPELVILITVGILGAEDRGDSETSASFDDGATEQDNDRESALAG